jgi:hypothetical protein
MERDRQRKKWKKMEKRRPLLEILPPRIEPGQRERAIAYYLQEEN